MSLFKPPRHWDYKPASLYPAFFYMGTGDGDRIFILLQVPDLMSYIPNPLFYSWPLSFLESRQMPFGVKGSSFISCLAGSSIGMLVSTRISGASVGAMCASMKSGWWSVTDEVLGSGAVAGAQRRRLDGESGLLEPLLALASLLGTFIQESLPSQAEWKRSPWRVWRLLTSINPRCGHV